MSDERTPSETPESVYEHHVRWARQVLLAQEGKPIPRAEGGGYFRPDWDDAEIATDHLFSCGGSVAVAPGKLIHGDTIGCATLALLLRRVRADEREKCERRMGQATPLATAKPVPMNAEVGTKFVDAEGCKWMCISTRIKVENGTAQATAAFEDELAYLRGQSPTDPFEPRTSDAIHAEVLEAGLDDAGYHRVTLRCTPDECRRLAALVYSEVEIRPRSASASPKEKP